MEAGFFFEEQGKRLYGFLHPASGKANGRPTAYVFCSPFAEEKVRTQRMFVNYARWLAARGIPVLRFDYRGHGDSEGEFQEAGFRSLVADVRAAVGVAMARTGAERCGLLGGRLGGTVALLAAAADERVFDAVLWDPIVDVHQYLLKLLRLNLSSQTLRYKKILYDRKRLEEMILAGEPVNVDGYLLGKEFYGEAMNCQLNRDAAGYAKSCLIAEVSAKELPAKPSLAEFRESLTAARACRLVATTDPVFWEAQRYYNPRPAELFRATTEWVEEQVQA